MTVGLIGRTGFLSVAYHRLTGTSLMVIWFPQPGDMSRIRELAQAAINRAFKRPSIDV